MEKKLVKEIISDYCVLDLETTGFSPHNDRIIEIGILKVNDDIVVEKYSQLVNPHCAISSTITRKTGITNDMVNDKPSLSDIKDDVLSFIGDRIIIGHNTSFDINFLEKQMSINIPIKYIDTCCFSKRVYPELENHKLDTLVAYLHLSNNEHRALADCISEKELYDAIKLEMTRKGLTIESLWPKKSSNSKRTHSSIVSPEDYKPDPDNFLYKKNVVITGTLKHLTREYANQCIEAAGGFPKNDVNKKTDYVVVSDEAYCDPENKSKKQIKAEAFKEKGSDLEIIDESTFYDFLKNDLQK